MKSALHHWSRLSLSPRTTTTAINARTSTTTASQIPSVIGSVVRQEQKRLLSNSVAAASIAQQHWAYSGNQSKQAQPLGGWAQTIVTNPPCAKTVAASRRISLINHHRRAFSSTTSQPTTDRLELYQYAICPFCNKTKAFLDYAGLPYDAIEVNPLTKQEIKWSPDYRKVPLARLTAAEENEEAAEKDMTIWKGSDEIVQGLLQQDWVTQQLNQKLGSTMTIQEFSSADDWVDYTNQKLAVLLYPNLCPTLTASYRAFDYVHKVETFSAWQRFWIQLVGSFAMNMAASRVKKKHQIEDERKALDEVLEVPVKHLENNQQFLSGKSEPHLGDLAVFGALRGLEGTSIHDEILEEKPVLREWYHRMESKMQQ